MEQKTADKTGLDVWSIICTGIGVIIGSPFLILAWLVHFIVKFFKANIYWVVGKGFLVLATLLIWGGLANLNVITDETVQRTVGTVTDFLFTNQGDVINRVFPHGDTEFWCVVVLAAILATKAVYDSFETD